LKIWAGEVTSISCELSDEIKKGIFVNLYLPIIPNYLSQSKPSGGNVEKESFKDVNMKPPRRYYAFLEAAFKF
jgi:hypothetical protein